VLDGIRRVHGNIEAILDLATEVERLRDAVRVAEAQLAEWLNAAARKRRTRDRANAPRRVWTRDRIVAALRARDARGERGVGDALGNVCRREFGSTAAAREAAGLAVADRRMRSWSKDRILTELRARVVERRPLGGIAPAAKRIFGTIAAAREAAGVPLDLRRTWSRERVIRELRAATEEPGPLDSNLAAACKRYFGSITDARKAAGVARARPPWTQDRVIDEVRAAWQSATPVGNHLGRVARAMFGSLNAAREAAGLPIEQRRTWTKEELLDELRGRWRSSEIGDKRAEWLCIKYFGSIAAARRAAGFSPLRRKWTERSVLAELRKNWRDRGVDDRAVEKACRRYFGSVGAARRAAGLRLYRAGNDRRFTAKP